MRSLPEAQVRRCGQCQKFRPRKDPTRGSADYAFLDLHLWLNGSMSPEHAHATSHVVKDRLMTKFPQLADVVIHIEPPPKSGLGIRDPDPTRKAQKKRTSKAGTRVPDPESRLFRPIRLTRHLAVWDGTDGNADFGLLVAFHGAFCRRPLHPRPVSARRQP